MTNLRSLTAITGLIALFLTVPTVTYIIGVANTKAAQSNLVLPYHPDDLVTARLDSLKRASQKEVTEIYNSVPVRTARVDRDIVIHGDTLVGHPHPVKIACMEARIEPIQCLWLGRAILSETDSVGTEMEHVAWVIRNRVDTRYRGRSTYRGVILDPWQFSAFNEGGGAAYRSLEWGDSRSLNHKTFQAALRAGLKVMKADESTRPFSQTTRHYYSPQSMVPVGSLPMWYVDVETGRGKRVAAYLNAHRFRFYDRVR